MKLAVLADIHGNLPALAAVIDDMAQFDVDHVIVAGDSVNMGPFSVEVIERLANERWAVIRGNHEMYILEHGQPDEPEHRKDWPIPRWLNEVMPTNLRYYMGALPDTLELYYPNHSPIRVLHASPNDHFRGIYHETPDDKLAQRLESIQAQTVITAHTHREMDRQVGRWHVINPGSVGLPLDGNSAARYVLLEGHGDEWRATFRQVEYDLAPIFQRFDELDFVGLHGATGRLMVEEFKTFRTTLWGFVKWKTVHYPDDSETLEMAEEYLNHPTARWDYMNPLYRFSIPNHTSNGGHD